ncbi:hypothetical protein C0995_015343 [Termitomyces sp. Mi166|nr:hypothetical protein C0995_015343 [Termitomyces sp. Mi166\
MATPSRPASTSALKSSGSKALNDYQLGDSLGKGAFGQVYRALNWATGETVAVKEIQLSNIPKAELGEIMSEIDLLKNLNVSFASLRSEEALTSSQHLNIVKYKGFVKTREYLYIILEFCENGSLHAILKRFGKFPENLVAVYISQVLEGLVYLHDQGVIHRDIKGANILTNKDGTVKLADFGVASNTTTGVRDDAVVGSPYWNVSYGAYTVAPEVIEQSGATTASDIWSVGCVVIELLEGHPPYHTLDPMPALFRIVQDDCPPIPEGASPIVKDFLYHCFQKDCNLRISAKKLLKHPWMVSARKQMSDEKIPGDSAEKSSAGQDGTKRPLSNYNYDEAVLKVQEWNEALKLAPSRPSKHPSRTNARPQSPTRQPAELPLPLTSSSAFYQSNGWKASSAPNVKSLGMNLVDKIQPISFVLQPPEEQTDNWDDDFEEGISFTKLQVAGSERPSAEEEKLEGEDNAQTIRPGRSPGSSVAQAPSSDIAPIVEDYSDLASEEDEEWLKEKVADFKMKNSVRRGLFHPDDIKTVGLGPSAPGPLSALLPILSRRPSRPALTPITPAGPSFGSNSAVAQGSHSRSSSLTPGSAGSFGRVEARRAQEQAFGKYAEDDDDNYEDVFGKLNGSLMGQPMQTLQLNTRLSNKSWLGDNSDDEDPFAEIDEGFSEDDLEANLQRDKYARLSNMVNQLIDELTASAPDFQLREACDQLLNIFEETPEMQVQFVSSHGMLAILEVLEGKCSRDVIMKLLQIINQMCSCRGLKVLVDLLDEDYTEQAELIVHALNGIGNVFELQTPTTKNDFCRMFIREGLLDPLSAALLNVMSNRGPAATDMKMKIIQILLVFSQVSQSDIHVRNALGTRKVIRRLLRACELLEPECLVLMLKAVKHLSMNANLLDVLQNANAIEILIRILDEQSSGPHSTEEAAQAGILPCLKRVIETSSPLKQFALPILCDLASAGKSCRTFLWQHDGLKMYLKLLDDPYFQVSALEAILSWLQDEMARVEDQLMKPEAADALLSCFVSAKANSFENLLDPFLKIIRLSTPIAINIAKSSAFFKRIIDRLGHNSKAVVRLNLLRVLRTVCEVHPNRAMLVQKYGLLGVVEQLSRGGGDGAVLVRELAREIVPTLKPGLKPAVGKTKTNGLDTPGRNGALAPKRMRRTASETSAIPLRSSNSGIEPKLRSGTNGNGGDGDVSTSRLGSVASRYSRQKLGDIPWQATEGNGGRR